MFLFFYCSQEKILDYPVQAVVHLQYDKGTSGSHSIVEDVGTAREFKWLLVEFLTSRENHFCYSYSILFKKGVLYCQRHVSITQ